MYNEGVSGITALRWWKNYKDSIENENYDAVFIYLGTNEGLTDTIEDDISSGDYNSFAETNTGGYCAIIEKIKDLLPNAKIYLISSNINSSNETWTTLNKIGEKYNLPIFNVADKRYYDVSLEKYHMPNDTTHYNTLGYFTLAKVLMIQCEEYISSHLEEYTEV